MKDSDFIVLFDDIPREGLKKSFTVEDGPAAGLETAVPLEGPLGVELFLARHGDEVLIRGRIAGSVALECSRCLAAYSCPLDVEVETCLQRGGGFSREPDHELAPEEMDVQELRRGSIDLRECITEHVHLGLPFKPLCGEECRGLCTRCGRDLNRESCSCPEEAQDHRWDALKGLKL